METDLKNKKILLTGGHPGPALAIIEVFKKDYRNLNIVFVGKKYNSISDKTLSFEYKEVRSLKIKFIEIFSGRSGNFFSINFFRELYYFILGFWQSIKILKNEAPDLVLTFGGYIGLPVAIAGYFLRVPVIAHEQTIAPGLANRLISFFAKKMCVSFPESVKFFPKYKTVVTGNPIRSSIFNTKKSLFEFTNNTKLPVIYVTGGSLGSHAVNILIEKILNKLLEKAVLIHQVGNVSEFNDYNRLKKLKNELPKDKNDRYFIFEHVESSNIGSVYSQADMVISRSGANTFFELLALEKPSILIPLPYSAKNEQEIHAKILQKIGGGVIFNQSEKPEILLQLIYEVIDTLEIKKKAYQKNARKYHARGAENLIKEIFRVLK